MRLTVSAAILSTAAGASAAVSLSDTAPSPSPSALSKARTAVNDPSAPFSVVVLPDTQNYSEFYPQIYNAQTQWIADNARSLNLKFVSHVGDVVNHGDRDNEWQVARTAMDTLDRANIPYGVAAGNHDVTPSGGAGTAYIPQKFLQYFGPQTFAGRNYFGGASPSGMSSFQRFSGGGRDFLAMHLCVDTPVEELAWAQGVLADNRDKPVMLTTHRYLQDAEDYTSGVPVVPSGRYPSVWYNFEGTYHPQGIQSNEFFDSFVRTNRNVFMVQCGHFHEEYRQTSNNLYGAPVHEVLSDYQDDPNGGDGWLRIMNFNTAADRIDVKSYSPTLGQFRTAGESQFSLGVDFDRYATRKGSRTISFQNGINGYTGTQDTWINQAAANTSYGNNTVFTADDDTNNSIFNDSRGQGLLRFDQMFTNNPFDQSKIPLGSVIESASLRIVLSDDVDSPIYDADFNVFLMTRDWSESSTWNSLSGGLTQGSDYSSFLGTIEGDNSPDGDYWRVLDLTAAVQAWSNGLPNFGIAILPEIISGNDDGVDFWSSENANTLYRPVLEITYRLPDGTLFRPVPAASTAAALLMLPMGGLRRRR
ncbi:MAG: DNRLRE domain-containing protein [Phycisphaerales bacterium]